MRCCVGQPVHAGIYWFDGLDGEMAGVPEESIAHDGEIDEYLAGLQDVGQVGAVSAIKCVVQRLRALVVCGQAEQCDL